MSASQHHPDEDRAPWDPPLSERWRMGLDLASFVVMAIVLVLVLVTFRDYGVTWDETWHLVYGDYILDWFLTFGRDRSALSYRLDYLYGGGFDLLGAIARRLSPLSAFETIHLLGALIGVVGFVGVWRLARRLAGPVGGLVAVVLLATTPVYYGHMFNNPKDLPFAVGYVWAIDALVAIVIALPRVPRRAWIRFAVVAGLAMGVRIAGILLLVYLAMVVGAYAWLRGRATRDPEAGAATLRRLGRPAAWSMLGAWLVMISTWPWALLDPIRRPWIALGNMSRYGGHRRTMPFAGEPMLTTEPRWDYLPHYFALTIPLSVLALALVAVVLVARAWWRDRDRQDATKRNLVLVLVAATLAPLVYAIVMRSVVYDGLRHFLFVVPLLVVVAAIAATVLPRAFGARARVVAVGVGIAVGIGVARQAADMRRLHPHQYLYFNELIGGLPGAHGNYDTDYYGNSYKEGFAALADHLWRSDREAFLRSRYLVTGCILDFIAANYIGGNFDWADDRKSGAEFYLGYTRSNCHMRYGSQPELLRIERDGTPLLLVRDLRHADASDDDDASTPDADPP